MRWIVVLIVAVHGLVHLMGFAKAFHYADLPQLAQPISRAVGILWLTAAVLLLVSAALIIVWPRGWWIVGAVALATSQVVIVLSWRDAWAGTIANVVLLAAVAYGWRTEGAQSFRAQFERDAAARVAAAIEVPLVTDAQVAAFPELVARYLRETGVVGQPRVRNYRLRFRGRIRSGPDTAWMPFEADQYSCTDPPSRLFLLRARMYGLPVEVFHRFVGGHATMKVRIAGLIPLVDARGDVMDRSETVTLFNDMCLLAPGTLLDPAIKWAPLDAQSVRAQFTNGDQTIAATLVFGDDRLIKNFISDDRSQASADGKSFTRRRFSTPVSEYRRFGGVRVAARAEARWLLPDGEFTYAEFDLLEADYNVQMHVLRQAAREGRRPAS